MASRAAATHNVPNITAWAGRGPSLDGHHLVAIFDAGFHLIVCALISFLFISLINNALRQNTLKNVVHLLAKTFDLVSGLTKGSWAFSGSVTALGSDNWSSHLCSAVLPTTSQIWDLVSIGNRLLKSPKFHPYIKMAS